MGEGQAPGGGEGSASGRVRVRRAVGLSTIRPLRCGSGGGGVSEAEWAVCEGAQEGGAGGGEIGRWGGGLGWGGGRRGGGWGVKGDDGFLSLV